MKEHEIENKVKEKIYKDLTLIYNNMWISDSEALLQINDYLEVIRNEIYPPIRHTHQTEG